MSKKEVIEYGRENGYGKRTCIVCGAIFTAMTPAMLTCSETCLKERRKTIHKKSCEKRKNWIAKLIEERDNLLIENLTLKKQLGLISEDIEEQNTDNNNLKCEENVNSATEDKDNGNKTDENDKNVKVIIPSQSAAKTSESSKYGSMKVERTCMNCGKVFMPTGSKQRFCEKSCRRAFEYKVKKEKRIKGNI